MKILLTTCLLLFATLSVASAQGKAEGSRQDAKANQAVPTRAQTKEAERLLSDMGYWTGPVDGRFDAATRSALIAFQKWNHRSVNGELTTSELEAIRAAGAPHAREVGYAHVEVDLDRQVLLLVDDNDGLRVLPISSGNGREFIDEGQTSVAYTPRGRFLVYRKGVGWEKGPLGSVYYPNDISGGIAIHGSRNVPNEPASHGCIRIPMFAAVAVSKLMPLGTIVLVYDKVSFVSAKEWIKNPKLKEAAIAISAAEDEVDLASATETKSKFRVIKRPRPRMTRAD